MSKDSPSAPPPRQLDVELSQILSQGPALLQSEAQLTPGQTAVDLSNLQLALEGAPAGSIQRPINGWVNRRTGDFSTQLPKGLDAVNWRPQTNYETIKTPAVSGLYDILSQATSRLGATQNASNTAARTATVSDLRNINPSQAALYDALATDAQTQLAAGDRLTPEQTYQITSNVRSDWSRRGLGNSSPAQLDEAVQLFAGGNALGQQRRANAASTAQLGNQLYTLPGVNFAPNNLGTAQNFLGFGSGYGQQPNILEQLGGYGADVFGTNYNARAAANINSANANNAAMGNAAQIAGALGTAAIMACWAAREVYGPTNPDWLKFRRWLLVSAPLKLRRWYLAHGPQWAERLRQNPIAKAVVKRWMNRRIQEVNYAI